MVGSTGRGGKAAPGFVSAVGTGGTAAENSEKIVRPTHDDQASTWSGGGSAVAP